VRLAADSHLQTCEACRRRLADIQMIFTALARLPAPALRSDLRPAVLARLPRKRSPLWTPAFAAQMGVALGGLAWAAMRLVPRLRLPPQLPEWPSLLALRALLPALPTFSPSSVLAPLLLNPAALLPPPASLLAVPPAMLSDLYSLFSLSHVPFALPHSLTGPVNSLLSNPLLRAASPLLLLGILLLCLLGNVALLRIPNSGQA